MVVDAQQEEEEEEEEEEQQSVTTRSRAKSLSAVKALDQEVGQQEYSKKEQVDVILCECGDDKEDGGMFQCDSELPPFSFSPARIQMEQLLTK